MEGEEEAGEVEGEEKQSETGEIDPAINNQSGSVEPAHHKII